MTLRILGKKNMTWCNPASLTDAPSLIAARRWFGCITHSTARHWISLWASSSAFMLLARISNLRSLCCIFQSLSMKRTIIANASPSLVFHQRSQKKHCWQLFRISQSLSPSDESWKWILLDGSEMSSDDNIFQEMVANCRLWKGEYLPSVEFPQTHIDRASCLQVMRILLLLRLL